MRLKRLTAIMLAAAMLCIASPTMAANNASGIDGWVFGVSKADADVYIDKTEGVKGNASLKVVQRTKRSSANNEYAVLSTTVTVKKDKTYYLEFDAKAKNANNVTVFFDWGMRSSLTSVAKSYDWLPHKLKYVSKTDASVVIRFSFDNATEALWLDNVKFYDTENPDENLIQNGNFENCSGGDVITADKTEPVVEEQVVDDYETGYMFATRGTIKVDGQLNDWEGFDVIDIARNQPLAAVKASDIDVDIRYAYDDENLYFAVVVENDDVHHAFKGSDYWAGDCMQFGIGDLRQRMPVMQERGVSYIEEGNNTYQTKSDFSAVATRTGTKMVYEVALPWTADFGDSLPEEILFCALVAQNDGEGRAYVRELSPGISNYKDATEFRKLLLLKEGQVQYGVSCEERLLVGESGKATVEFVNSDNKERQVSVRLRETGEEKSVIIAPGEKKRVELSFDMTEKKVCELNFEIDCGEKSVVTKKVSGYIEYDKAYPDFKARIDDYVRELKELLMQCNKRGISTDYETAAYSLICKSVETIEMMAENNYFTLFEEFDRVITREYEESVKMLKAYLNGEKKPLLVPKYINGSNLNLNGTTVYAQTEKNGIKQERPVFFVGFGHWDTAAEAMPLFSNMGLNTIQTEATTIKEVFVPRNFEGWDLRDGLVNGNIEVTDEVSASGGYSAKITNKDSFVSNKYISITQPITVEPDTTYIYGLKAKGKNIQDGYAWFGVNGFEMDGRMKISDSEDWTEYDFEVTTGPERTQLDFIALFEGKIDELYIDDCYLIKKGSNENLLKNSGFDYIRPKNKYDEEAAELGFEIKWDKFEQLEETLKTAQQNNFIVDVGVCPNYIPEFLIKMYPDIQAAASPNSFLPITPDSEEGQKIISLWARVLASEASKYDCVHSMTITNEPAVKTSRAGNEYYLPMWHEFLKERYGSIDKLNRIYESEYKSFEEVLWPDRKDSTVWYNDWRNFNEAAFARFHKIVADAVNNEFPQLFVHAKIMDYFRYDNEKWFVQGANWELNAEHMDVCGCDAFSFYGKQGSPLQAKMSWYDFMTSVKNAPVWDTETHISDDGSLMKYDDVVEYYNGADIWNGAIHGRGNGVIWIWDLTVRSRPWKNGIFSQSNYMMRPADVAEITRAALDLNRLSKEVEAVQKAQRKVGILYSATANSYSEDIFVSTLPAYEDAIFSGQKVGFITETKPEEMHHYDLVIVPDAQYVPAGIVNNLEKYIKNGGEVLITNDTALRFDEYKQPHNAAILDYIYDNAEVGISIMDKIEEMQLSDVVLVNAETGERLDNIEWSYAEYKGKIVVNVLNYDFDNRVAVKIKYKGREIADFTELRSDERYKNQIELNPYQAVLLQFDI